jgi:hypothetical protein
LAHVHVLLLFLLFLLFLLLLPRKTREKTKQV